MTDVQLCEDLIVQSPKFDDESTFISAALSYNPRSGVTSGFLGYVHDPSSSTGSRVTKGTMDNVLEGLVSTYFAPYALNPLLLPVLILNSLHDYNENKLEESRVLINEAERLINDMSNIFSNSWETQQSMTKATRAAAQKAMVDYDNAHNNLEKCQNTLLRETFPFIQELGANCKEASESVERWAEAKASTNGRTTLRRPGLQNLITRLTKVVSRHEGRRERLYKRMKVATGAVCKHQILWLSVLMNSI